MKESWLSILWGLPQPQLLLCFYWLPEARENLFNRMWMRKLQRPRCCQVTMSRPNRFSSRSTCLLRAVMAVTTLASLAAATSSSSCRPSRPRRARTWPVMPQPSLCQWAARLSRCPKKLPQLRCPANQAVRWPALAAFPWLTITRRRCKLLQLPLLFPNFCTILSNSETGSVLCCSVCEQLQSEQ